MSITPGKTVRLPGIWKGHGNAGATYTYAGTAASVDLNSADYTDPCSGTSSSPTSAVRTTA